MARRLRWLARLLAGLVVAAWSLLLIAWLTLHWGILPQAERWRPQIAERASKALGIPVQIGNITVRSSGWIPAIELRDVVLKDRDGRDALALPRVFAAVSARSLLAFELRFEQLLIEGPRLEVQRDRRGHLIVAGLDLSGDGGSDDHAAANWFFAQHEFVIRHGAVRWTDQLRDAPPLQLDDVELVVRNSLRRHDVRLDATPPREWGERFSLRGRFRQSLLGERGDWRQWSGSAYAELPRADVRELRRHVDLPFEIDAGEGALRAWVDIDKGQPVGAAADLALDTVAVRLVHDAPAIQMGQVQGRLVGRRQGERMSVAAERFGFVTGDGQVWPRGDVRLEWQQHEGQPATAGSFAADRIDLAVLAQIASRVPLGQAARQLLGELEPHGIVTGLAGEWRGPLDAPTNYRVKAQLAGIALAAKASPQPESVGRPGFRNATLQVEADERGGRGQIAIVDGAVELPGVFAEPVLPLVRFDAAMQWHIDPQKSGPPKLSLQLKNASFANADAAGRFDAEWHTGAGDAVARGGRLPGVLDLRGTLAHGSAAQVARYLPLGIPQDARDYVQRAVLSGEVRDASFRVRGDLWDFPFHRLADPKQGEFRIAGRVERVGFAYVPAEAGREPLWPPFQNVSGQLVFDRASMEIHDATAQLYGVELSKIHGGIRQLAEKPVLALEGQGRGRLGDMLRFVNASPVGEWTGNALARATGTGLADLRLALTLPLERVGDSSVKGAITLGGNDLRLTPDTPLLAASRGRIDFTHKGFAVVGASARALGGELQFEGGTRPDGSQRFSGQGVASAEGLRRASELGLLSRLAGSLSGQTPYRVSLGLVRGQPELQVTTTLAGIASDLPEPLRKSAEAPMPLRYQTTLNADATQDTLRLDVGTLLQAQYQRDLAGAEPRVLRGAVAVLEPLPTPQPGVVAVASLPSVDLDRWQAVAERVLPAAPAGAPPARGTPAAAPEDAGNGYVPSSIALRATQLSAGGRSFQRVVAGLTHDEGGLWRANVQADQLGGYIEYRPGRGPNAAGGVMARLTRLVVPKSDIERVETYLEEKAPTSVPALDIVVDDLQLRDRSLGRVEVEAVNRGSGAAREWRLNRLVVANNDARLSATGTWSAAGGSGPRRRAAMSFKLDLANAGALLDRLGQGGTMRGGKGQLTGEVSWLGSPLTLDFASMSGQVNVAVDAGQFLKAQPGAARLLSVLSLQSIPRRLALDFRDLFQEGFAFDAITGDVRIDDGSATTNNLRMRGLQAAVLMEGRADLVRETQDLRVVIVPVIDASTASLAYAVINPAIGLGTFLAQTLLRKPMIEAGTREFHVTGSWADPKIERVQRQPGAPLPGASAPAVAATPSEEKAR